MGPAGWLKCPLKSTNKRFLLNTLRSTSLKRRSDESKPESASRDQRSSESSDRRHYRSRSPPHRDEALILKLIGALKPMTCAWVVTWYLGDTPEWSCLALAVALSQVQSRSS
ncbi:hypothetical protein WMY93_030782 [Mugilogobius chulae]|uniref:Uncharacterized protein n=1 Tax=Mugilogobius chulae TaxID=88201 RepID=A0AAW0MIM0_9GOBI